MAAAVALPSRIVAGTADSVPEWRPRPATPPYAHEVRAPSPPAVPRGVQMSEREQSPAAGAKGGAGDWREQTIPDMRPVGSPRTDTRPSGPRFGTGRGPAYVPDPGP